jgi:hypothetical protein
VHAAPRGFGTAALAEFANDHAPFLRFDSEEKYFPQAIDDVFHAGHVQVERSGRTYGRLVDSGEGVDAMLNRLNWSDSMLRGIPSLDLGRTRQHVIYFSIARSDDLRWAWIDYWIYYQKDPKLVEPHVSDWEAMGTAIYTPNGLRAHHYRLAHHKGADSYQVSALEHSRSGHPIVYVQGNAHALYPNKCERRYPVSICAYPDLVDSYDGTLGVRERTQRLRLGGFYSWRGDWSLGDSIHSPFSQEAKLRS